jgi:hypothetical protein
MRPLKFLSLLPLYFLALTCAAQDAKDTMSFPLQIPATGWNKVLCMKNGYTMLFHFEPEKAMTVIVFDSVHKKVTTKEHVCKVLDVAALRNSVFKGLYDIGGEAVLFIEQEHLSRHQLVRVRFNGRKGTLIEEKIMGESQGMSKPTYFFVAKNKDDDSYSILFCSEYAQFKECKIYLANYNNKHELTGEVPIDVDRKKYDYLDLIGLEWQPTGTMVTMVLSTLKMNGTPSHAGNFDAVPDIYDHYLAIYYIPKGSNHARDAMVDVSTDVFPYYSLCSYNSFAQSINLYVLSYIDAVYRNGIELIPTAITKRLFFKIDEDAFSPHFAWIVDRMANDYLRQHTDTNKYFQGLPVKMFTNANGLSTVVSESFSRYTYDQYGRAASAPYVSFNRRSSYRFVNEQSHQRSRVFETYMGPIGITQFDDDGKEIWGMVLPRSQYFKSYQRYYFAHEFAKRWQDQLMFGDWPPEVYTRQFLSFNTYSYGKNFYVILNDYDKNIDNTLKEPGDTVYAFENANTFCYKINSKREVTKNYLFGEPKREEYHASLIEGADFDEKTGVYATLIQLNRYKTISLRMAWQHLD